VLANNESWSAPMDETYQLLGVDPASITGLDQYLQVRTGQKQVALGVGGTRGCIGHNWGARNDLECSRQWLPGVNTGVLLFTSSSCCR